MFFNPLKFVDSNNKAVIPSNLPQFGKKTIKGCISIITHEILFYRLYYVIIPSSVPNII